MVAAIDKVLPCLSRYGVVLASASPRRRELLAQLGVEFEVRPLKGVDESYPDDLPSEEVARYIAEKKCAAYMPHLAPDELVITADTVVVSCGSVLGKPADENQARAMLHELSGHAHTVVTGVAVATSERIVVRKAVTEVEFAPLSDVEIDYYVERYSPMDKAGAYGIQEWIGCMGVRRINGSYYNVMGLPLHVLYTMLKEF